MLKDQNVENMRNPEYAIGKRKKMDAKSRQKLLDACCKKSGARKI